MPGLLAHKLGHLHSFAQNERSSVAQAYVTLFAIVLDHAVLTLRRGDETTATLKVHPLSPFLPFVCLLDPVNPYPHQPLPKSYYLNPRSCSVQDSETLTYAGKLQQTELLSTSAAPLKPFHLPRHLAVQYVASVTASGAVLCNADGSRKRIQAKPLTVGAPQFLLPAAFIIFSICRPVPSPVHDRQGSSVTYQTHSLRLNHAGQHRQRQTGCFLRP